MSKVMPKNKKDSAVKIFCDISRCVSCKSCELACATEHSQSKDLDKAISESPKPKQRVLVSAVGERTVSIHCQHCEDAPCVEACMSGALSKDRKTGATVQDMDKCVGCWMCVMSCPFGAVIRSIEQHRALKCDLCQDREDYACVSACPTGALFIGTKDEFKKHLQKNKVKG